MGQAPENLERRPVVVGFGPCGIFAALLLAQMGFKPIVLERGKKVRERTKDTWGLWRKNVLNPESNVQFGEGGAGTFSDGKLYSQIKDPRHLGRKVLTEFVKAGAPEEILYVAKPHIGTFRLVSMVEKMRADIEALGGEIRFQQRVVDIHMEDGPDGRKVARGLTLASGEQIRADHIVLALGHSARDSFEMLHGHGVYMEAKPFSVGFRIEHPQTLIDKARWGKYAGHPLLGAADYKLVHHASNGRAVYSFCMCPGGQVVAATSEEGRVVTNGMSQYSRAERNANSGLVVSISPDDYPGDPLAGIAFQRELESRAYVLGGGTYEAPAQLGGRFSGWPAVHSGGLGAAILSARRALDGPGRGLAGLLHRGDARSAAGVRQEDPRLRYARRGADRGGNPHQFAAAHHSRRGLPELERARPVPGRRGRRLRRGDSVRRGGRHQGGGGGSAGHLGRTPIKPVFKFLSRLRRLYALTARLCGPLAYELNLAPALRSQAGVYALRAVMALE
ncbi:hypothetical protein JOS77_29340 [Chromobacterium haemolyticum]|nr:hypothetical protein JOS77_29340 [Chromobacterium haemolyticum]